jgi:hypothetical protein
MSLRSTLATIVLAAAMLYPSTAHGKGNPGHVSAEAGYFVRSGRWYTSKAINLQTTNFWGSLRFRETLTPRFSDDERDLILEDVPTEEKTEIFQIAAVLGREEDRLRFIKEYIEGGLTVYLSGGVNFTWNVADPDGIDFRITEPNMRFFTGGGLRGHIHHPLSYLPFPIDRLGIGGTLLLEYQVPFGGEKSGLAYSFNLAISYGHGE